MNATKYVLSLEKYPNARCLDGSPGAFYVSRPSMVATSTKFYLYQDGGGFCADLEHCVSRANTSLGSSARVFWPESLDLDAENPYMGFSRSLEENPLLASWTHVFLVYCDGAYFSGSNATPTHVGDTILHFRGRDIFLATLAELSDAHGLGDASSDVMLGGCSAGGIATLAHADWAARALAASPVGAEAARFSAFPISGFYLDVDYFTSQKAFPFLQSNVSEVLPQACLTVHAAQPHKCLVGEVNAPYLESAVFAWQSKFDADQLATSFPPPGCADAACADPYARRMVASLHSTLWQNRSANGGFLEGCWQHCWDTPDPRDTVAQIAMPDGVTPLQALASWYARTPSDNGHRKRTWEQTAPTFPCRNCCSVVTASSGAHVLPSYHSAPSMFDPPPLVAFFVSTLALAGAVAAFAVACAWHFRKKQPTRLFSLA